MRTQPKARQAKNRARLARFDELNSQELQTRNETQEIYIPPGPRLGDSTGRQWGVQGFRRPITHFRALVFCAQGSHRWHHRRNGAGKSTLFRMISGEETPDAGTVDVGETVHLGYVDQSRDSLSDENGLGGDFRGQ